MLKELGEEVKRKMKEVKDFETEWISQRLGIDPSTTLGVGFSHIEHKDPYWNDYTGRAKDDKDMEFEVRLNLDGENGRQIVGRRVSAVNCSLSPHHNFTMEDEQRGIPAGETYDIRVTNPLSWTDTLYKKEAERRVIQAKSDEIKALIEGCVASGN